MKKCFTEEQIIGTQRYWLKHVRACEASGKRITEYATDHGLGVHVMYDGKRALVKKGVLPRTHATRFQRAQMVDPVFNGGSRFQYPSPNGTTQPTS